MKLPSLRYIRNVPGHFRQKENPFLPGAENINQRSSKMSVTENKKGKLFLVVLLAVILIGIVLVQVRPELSKAGLWTDETEPNFPQATSEADSGFMEKIPQMAKSYVQREQAGEKYTRGKVPHIEASYIYDDGKSYISVGAKMIREGEVVDGFTFVKAYLDRVEFEKDGKIFTGTVQNYQRYGSSSSND
jgi:hypothetical protein